MNHGHAECHNLRSFFVFVCVRDREIEHSCQNRGGRLFSNTVIHAKLFGKRHPHSTQKSEKNNSEEENYISKLVHYIVTILHALIKNKFKNYVYSYNCWFF